MENSDFINKSINYFIAFLKMVENFIMIKNKKLKFIISKTF
jgi:hypothetical protein